MVSVLHTNFISCPVGLVVLSLQEQLVVSVGGTDFEGRRGTQEVELNNDLFLSFLVLLSSKIF